MSRAALALLLLPLLASCAASVPERALPGLPPGHALPEVMQADPADAPLAEKLSADPAFAPLVAAATAGSPDLEAAVSRIAEARAGRAAATAALAPRVDGAASVTRSRVSLDQFGFTLPPGQQFERDRTLFAPTIEIGWEADLFGRLSASRRAAALRLGAAEADAAAVRLALAAEVARGLVAIRALDARGAELSTAAAAARRVEALAAVRAEAGLASGLDLAAAASETAVAEAALAPPQAAREAEVAALMRLTGLPMAELLGILLPVQPLPRAWAIPAVPSDALARRPDIAAAHARLLATDQDAAAALAARFPRITLTGSVGFLASAASGLFTADALAASLGGALAGPILDFGRAAAEVERARARSAVAVADYRGAVLGAIAEVEANLAATRAARRQAMALAESVARLERAMALVESQVAAGLSGADALADAERRLAQGRDSRLAAEAAALDAAIRLEAAVGGSAPPDQAR
jgi:NodT family efflux transporter outer membrane factor (OMF) lipoprotein